MREQCWARQQKWRLKVTNVISKIARSLVNQSLRQNMNVYTVGDLCNVSER